MFSHDVIYLALGHNSREEFRKKKKNFNLI